MIKKEDIKAFYTISTKENNDKNNRIRESIIPFIVNKQYNDKLYKNTKWKKVIDTLHKVIDIELNNYAKENKINDTENIKLSMRQKGGRSHSYDFEIIFEYNKVKTYVHLEFKYNSTDITDIPQFYSPSKPSVYFENSYEKYYYENYLVKFYEKNNMTIPTLDTYLKEINSNKPNCIAELKIMAKRNKKIKEELNKLSKDSIKEFIKVNNLDIEKLSNKFIETQKNKKYLFFKNENFIIKEYPHENLIIKNIIKINCNNSWICEIQNNKMIKVLLQWKNGNGIAYPALQISLMKKLINK